MRDSDLRRVTETFICLIENALDYKPDMPKITDEMTVGEYRHRCEITRRCAAEAQLDLIRTNVKWMRKFIEEGESNETV